MQAQQSRTLGVLITLLTALLAVLLVAEPVQDDTEHDHTQACDGVSAADVSGLEITSASTSIRLARDASGWRITSPVVRMGAAEAIEPLVESVRTLQVSEPLELHDPLSSVGLDSEQRIQVTLQAGQHSSCSLTIGADVAVGGGTYVMDHQGNVRVSELPIRGVVQVDPGMLQSNHLAKFAASSVHRVSIRYPARHITIEQAQDGWEIVADSTLAPSPHEPISIPAAPDTVNATISSILGLEAEWQHAAPPDADVTQAIIALDTDAETVTIELSEVVDGKMFARGPELDGIVTVAASAVPAAVLNPGHDWRRLGP